MKRALIVTALAGAIFVGFSAPAEAGHRKWGFHFGVDSHGGSFQFGYNRRHGHRWRRYQRRHHHRHVHVRTPIYQKVWCEPAYREVFAGYDECGNPIYRSVCVSAGYYKSVCVGYHCPPCGYRY